MMKTLFLNPPWFDGFDGAAGSRYQARREVRSFWYPTWLAQLAALVEGSRLIDAPARGITLDGVRGQIGAYELCVLYTSTPTFPSDVRIAETLKAANPRLLIGFVGPHVAIQPDSSVLASDAIDFVAGVEFDYTILEVAQGRPLSEIDGLSWKRDGEVVHNKARAVIEDMDALPFVAPVYHRDLVMEDYFCGYLLHPYVSFYTGRGCRSKCSFCLWPQTIGGNVYRTRSPASVAAAVRPIKELFPAVKEVFFDDDTFTDDLPRAEAIARLLGPMGITWSCNAKANVPFATLKVLRDNGLRLLLVGYESGNQEILNNIRKGTRLDIMRKFAHDCNELGITTHGTFVLGLPGETQETVRKSIQFAIEINPHTIQVSLAAPYPGTELYRQAIANGWMLDEGGKLVQEEGLQICSLSYPDLSREEINKAVALFYKKFYFRPSKIIEITKEMFRSWDMTKRRLREGVEFFHYLRDRGDA
ncbi:MAG: hopanoid biosynthesis associated radical SAM protein HpnJ [Alphaproteobacteria bacterium]|nr:hopanoid biosynthesis associated radical SAM protein HpnJ [Alphaproteobacteria bacterium]